MFYYNTEIARVTEDQIARAKEIIPSLNMMPVTSVGGAFLEALGKSLMDLRPTDYVDETLELVVLNKGELMDATRKVHYAREAAQGWLIQLRVSER